MSDKKKPADRFFDQVRKFFPTSPENCERNYEDRNYTNEQLVEKNHKQKQKSISADTTALATLGLVGSNNAERRGYKRMATSNMLKKRGVAERELTTAEIIGSIGDGTGLGSLLAPKKPFK